MSLISTYTLANHSLLKLYRNKLVLCKFGKPEIILLESEINNFFKLELLHHAQTQEVYIILFENFDLYRSYQSVFKLSLKDNSIELIQREPLIVDNERFCTLVFDSCYLAILGHLLDGRGFQLNIYHLNKDGADNLLQSKANKIFPMHNLNVVELFTIGDFKDPKKIQLGFICKLPANNFSVNTYNVNLENGIIDFKGIHSCQQRVQAKSRILYDSAKPLFMFFQSRNRISCNVFQFEYSQSDPDTITNVKFLSNIAANIQNVYLFRNSLLYFNRDIVHLHRNGFSIYCDVYINTQNIMQICPVNNNYLAVAEHARGGALVHIVNFKQFINGLPICINTFRSKMIISTSDELRFAVREFRDKTLHKNIDSMLSSFSLFSRVPEEIEANVVEKLLYHDAEKDIDNAHYFNSRYFV